MIIKYFPLAVTVGLFLLIYFLGQKISPSEVEQLVSAAGVFGPLAFIFLILLTNIIAPLGAAPFLFSGFYLYNREIVIYSYIAAVLSAVINFYLSKFLGRLVISRFIGADEIKKIEGYLSNFKLRDFLFVRILLYQHHDIISYVAGFSLVRFWPYFITSCLGMGITALTIYSLSHIFSTAVEYIAFLSLLSYGSLAVYLVLTRVWKNWYNPKT